MSAKFCYEIKSYGKRFTYKFLGLDIFFSSQSVSSKRDLKRKPSRSERMSLFMTCHDKIENVTTVSFMHSITSLVLCFLSNNDSKVDGHHQRRT